MIRSAAFSMQLKIDFCLHFGMEVAQNELRYKTWAKMSKIRINLKLNISIQLRTDSIDFSILIIGKCPEFSFKTCSFLK